MPIGTSYRAMLAAAGVDAGAAYSYAVGGNDPATVADFSGILNSGTEYYRTGGSDTTFDSMFSYTGASRKTMTDSDGVLKWAPHNVLKQSSVFNDGNWNKLNLYSSNPSVTPNQSDGPDADGGGDADLVTFGTINANNDISIIRQSAPSSPYYQYTFAVWMKSNGAAHDGKRVYVYLNNVGAIRAYTACVLSSSWQQITVTGTHNAGSPYFSMATAGSVYFDGLGSASDSDAEVLMWGAHAYRSDLGGMVNNPDRGDSYVPTTTSAVYLPRRNSYRWNGSSYVNKGITLESEPRTNKQDYSNDFSQWSIGNTDSVTLTSADEIGPDGLSSMTKLEVTDTTSETHYIGRAYTVNTNVHTHSYFVKPGTQRYVTIRHYTNSNSWAAATFDLTAISVTQVDGNGGTHIDSGIYEVANGIYRIYLTASATVSTTGGMNLQFNSSGTPTLNSGDGLETAALTTGHYIHLYGAQVEEASTPSSYIPTVGATGTRAAETLTSAGSNFVAGSTDISMHIAGEVNMLDSNNGGEMGVFQQYVDANNNYVFKFDTDRGTGGLNLGVEVGGSFTRKESFGNAISAPGTNLLYNVAMRNSATDDEINIASSGTADTASAWTDAVPDLSSASMEFGTANAGGQLFSYSGTFSIIRFWDVDLGESGIETASS